MSAVQGIEGTESEIEIARFITEVHQRVAANPNGLGFRIARKPGIPWLNALKRARRRRLPNNPDGQIQVNVSLRTLLRLDDSEFVRKAYIKLLGRRPDPSGYATHLSLLRGHRSDRIRVLEILSQCPEGRARNARVRGLKLAILWNRLFIFDANIQDLLRHDGSEFVDLIYAKLLRREPDPAGYAYRLLEAHRGKRGKIRVLAELAASPEGRGKDLRIRGLLRARVWNRLVGYDVRLKEIMRYDGTEFVDRVFADLLRRAPDPAGYEIHLAEAEREGGRGKINVLAGVVASHEGRERRLTVRGLRFAVLRQKLYETIAAARRRARALAGRATSREDIGKQDPGPIARTVARGVGRLELRTDGAGAEPGQSVLEAERSEA